MSDIEEPKPNESRTWRERLSQALLREPQDREQLVKVLREAEQNQLLDPDALSMIEGVMQTSEMQVRDIMIPRAQIVAISIEQSLNEVLSIVIDTAHSRFPVLNDDPDEVVGILHAKDLLQLLVATKEEKQQFSIKSVIRPAVIVPESKRLNTLLKEFRLNRNHMAIVVDEYGGIAGFITIEDILEQIVGEIEDEFDVDEAAYIKELTDDEFIVKAVTPIDEFNSYFNVKFSDDEFDTIGGIVMHSFGHLPKRGEKTEIDAFLFEILRADKRRVYLLRATKIICPPAKAGGSPRIKPLALQVVFPG